MARNEVFEGDKDVFALPVPSGTKAGDPVRVSGLNGVAQTDRADTSVKKYNADGTTNAQYNWGGGNVDGEASVKLRGAHKFPVGTTTALAKGDPVYITSGNALTPVSSGNSLFGHALTAKGTTAGELVTVRIAN